MIKRCVAGIIGGIMLGMSGMTVTEAAPPAIPEDIFEWVQSSARSNYFFNKAQMCYETNSEGYQDKNIIICPVIKTFDDVQIQDIKAKRRWNMLDMSAYEDLAGEAEYLRIDLSKRTVQVTQHDFIDSTLTTIESTYPNVEIKLEDLSDHSRDYIFYDAIIKYAEKHAEDLEKHSKGKVPEVKAEADTKTDADSQGKDKKKK